MRRLILICVLFVAACASVPSGPDVTPAPVIAAERAFAARGQEIGWVAAFREYAAPDGMLGNFDNAQEAMAQTPDEGASNLYWWPAYAGIARSGDLGFTTGPFSIDETRRPIGQYFTVWRRQADGTWKWIWDGGPGRRTDPPNEGVEAADIPMLPVASRGAGSAAGDQVAAIEAGHTSSSALVAYLAADARVFRQGLPTATAASESLVFPRPDLAYAARRTEASEAGDLVFTLGEAHWSQDGQARKGQYARLWQYRPEGWRIVYDQLVAPPPS